MEQMRHTKFKNIGSKCIQTCVYYDKGGWNVWHGKKEPRGYWLSISVGTGNGAMFEYAPFDSCNYRIFLEETKRFSQKRMLEIKNLLLVDEVTDNFEDKAKVMDYAKAALQNQTA